VTLAKTTLEQWAVLAAVVDNGGFAQAAAALNRSQSAVSYSVARLQESLDLPVLVGEGRKSVLTPHGHTLLKRARELLKEMDMLEFLARSLKQGWESELKLVVDAAFPRERLLRIVEELQRTCPDTQIQLSDVVLSGAEQAIVEGGADLVVTSRVPPGHLSDWLLDVTFVAVARADHERLGAPCSSGGARLRHRAATRRGLVGSGTTLHCEQHGGLIGHRVGRPRLRVVARTHAYRTVTAWNA
jgi:DNA-binding transcriptional LysR family regulator